MAGEDQQPDIEFSDGSFITFQKLPDESFRKFIERKGKEDDAEYEEFIKKMREVPGFENLFGGASEE